MRVLTLQFDIAWDDKQANFDRVRRMLAGSAPGKGGLIVLPETFATGFSMNVAAIAEAPEGQTERFLAELAVEYKACVLGGLVTIAGDGRGLNQAVAFGPSGELLARYTKLHPFSYAGEDEHYAPGDSIETLAFGGLTIAPMICYDLRFPEAFRSSVRAGADCFVVIANWPAARAGHWDALLAARAIENQAFVIGVNRCGNDPKNAYAGGSRILGPSGGTITSAGAGESVLTAEIVPDDARRARDAFPALRDMRKDLDA
jgi:omega-amidase